jgi:hypothetical protein
MQQTLRPRQQAVIIFPNEGVRSRAKVICSQRGAKNRFAVGSNDDQKAEVKDIFADTKIKREAVLTDNSLSDDQKKNEDERNPRGRASQGE